VAFSPSFLRSSSPRSTSMYTSSGSRHFFSNARRCFQKCPSSKQFCSDPVHNNASSAKQKPSPASIIHTSACCTTSVVTMGINYLVMECVEGESLAVIVHNWVPTRLNSLGCNEGVAGRFCSLTRRVPSFILAQDALDVRRKFTQPIGTHTESDLCYDPLITLRE
jgi:hypothetical protein